MSRRFVSAIALGWAASTFAPLVAAQTDARRELIQRGVSARDAGDHATALDLFLRAGVLEMRPGLRLSIAQEQRAVGRARESCESATRCVADLQGDLGSPESARIMPACVELVVQLCATFARVRVTTPQPLGTEEELLVQGRAATVASGVATVFADPGEVRVELRRGGTTVFSRTVTAAVGSVSLVAIDQASTGAAPGRAPTSGPSGAQPQSARESAATVNPASSSTPHPSTQPSSRPAITAQWWFWTALSVVLIGGTMAGLAAGGVFDYPASPVGGTSYTVNAIQSW
jgi:hypothetical protein